MSVVPGKSDAEVATELKNKLVEAMQSVFKVLDEASAAKFEIQFSVGPNAMGKQQFAALKIMKVFQ